MKVNRLTLKFFTIVLVVVSVVSSCTKDNKDPDTEYSYFVTKELSASYSQVYINNLISIVSGTIPEVASFAGMINSDINIYRVVYKTTINGNEIKASGLVCVPVTPGEYPVLSFQNGTNTVNANAPGENPLSYSYQLVEILASMGYIVVIADYPGFGESAQLTHPYLVAKPTVRSLIDMLFAVDELAGSELPDITLKNSYYLLGYSQGGWATLALHKAMEQEYSSDFNLAGSACGAGPYNIYLLLQEMINRTDYPMPVYLGYILNSYNAYNQFTNPVSDIFNEPYATRISTLYNGLLTSEEINDQLTTNINELLTEEFLSGFSASSKYASVREAINNNSIASWHTNKPLMLIHGSNDTHVNPVSTDNMYSSMIQAGTSEDIIEKVFIPDADHGDGIIPAMIQGVLFLNSLTQ